MSCILVRVVVLTVCLCVYYKDIQEIELNVCIYFISFFVNEKKFCIWERHCLLTEIKKFITFLQTLRSSFSVFIKNSRNDEKKSSRLAFIRDIMSESAQQVRLLNFLSRPVLTRSRMSSQSAKINEIIKTEQYRRVNHFVFALWERKTDYLTGGQIKSTLSCQEKHQIPNNLFVTYTFLSFLLPFCLFQKI